MQLHVVRFHMQFIDGEDGGFARDNDDDNTWTHSRTSLWCCVDWRKWFVVCVSRPLNDFGERGRSLHCQSADCFLLIHALMWWLTVGIGRAIICSFLTSQLVSTLGALGDGGRDLRSLNEELNFFFLSMSVNLFDYDAAEMDWTWRKDFGQAWDSIKDELTYHGYRELNWNTYKELNILAFAGKKCILHCGFLLFFQSFAVGYHGCSYHQGQRFNKFPESVEHHPPSPHTSFISLIGQFALLLTSPGIRSIACVTAFRFQNTIGKETKFIIVFQINEITCRARVFPNSRKNKSIVGF